MKARLMKTENSDYDLLCFDGTIKRLAKRDLTELFSRFKDDKYLCNGKDGRWDKEAMDMSDIAGDTIAYVVDIARDPGNKHLVIIDPTPFVNAFKPDDAGRSVNLIPISEYAAKYGVTSEIIKVYCREARIPGAVKVGKYWFVPKNSAYPTYQRKNSINRVPITTHEAKDE